MGQNQSEGKIVEYLNKHQKTYFIQSEVLETSNNRHFVGFKRINNDSDNKNLAQNENFDPNKRFALKVVPYYNESSIKEFDNEQEILNLFKDDPQILKREGTIELTIEFKKYFLVSTKYCHFGDVYYYIWHLDQISEDIVRTISFQALQILKILKDKHVLHNNIKFENFLVESINPIKILLTDFRQAQILKENEKSNNPCVTSFFKAPEVLEHKDHDYSSDIWSLGVDIYLSLFSQLPFGINKDDNDNVILDKIRKNALTNINNSAPLDAWECITKILVLNPDERITPHDALKLNWFIPEINKESAAPAASDLEVHVNLEE